MILFAFRLLGKVMHKIIGAFSWTYSEPNQISKMEPFLRKLFTRKLQVVGNKPKGRVSKRVFQENKASQIFLKTNISYPQLRTHTYVCLRNDRFS